MLKTIPIGTEDFKKIIEDNFYYVDKSLGIEKLLKDGCKVVSFPRPRRFAKTLFTSMMYYYYNINSKDKFNRLFKDTYVYDNPTKNKNIIMF